jgi:hypothetical protein
METLLMKNSWIILIVVIFSMDLAFCQETIVAEPSVPEASLNPSTAKEILQNSYALKVATLIINAIYVFKQKYYPRVPRQEDVIGFAQGMLMYGEDPLVQAVEYEPDKSLIIIMQNKKPVISQLRAERLELVYNAEKNWWQITKKLPTVAATSPDFFVIGAGIDIIRDYKGPKFGMELVTDYCKKQPREKIVFPDMLSDTLWCPAWLDNVMR